MQLQEIIIEVILNNLEDVSVLKELVDMYREKYDLLEDRYFEIELNKVLILNLRPEL
jgi:hypothetical protein